MMPNLASDQQFIVTILTINFLVWQGLRLFFYQKLSTVYLIARSWWWLLVVLFSCYLWSQWQDAAGSYPYRWVLDGLFVLIGAQGGFEIFRVLRNRLAKKHTLFTVILTVLLFTLILGLILLHHLTLSHHQHGVLLFVLFASQFNDIAQYLCGKALGQRLFKQKLAPTISPNKTIEGAVFGSLLSSLLAALLGLWLTPFGIIVCFGVAYVLAVTGICGDLLVSAFKRRYQVKDMGELLPGHGGILDRVDSLLIGVPLFTLIYWQAYPSVFS